MAYVKGYKNDVFVSYAHRDNEGPHNQREGGWVDTVASKLQSQLEKRLVAPPNTVTVWTDYDLPTNKPITPELLKEVRASALLLVVLSPYYLLSEWCVRERDAFLALAQERLAEGHVFLINYANIDHGRRPKEFGDLKGDDFFVFDRKVNCDRPLGEFDPREPAFEQQIYALSVKMAGVLREMSSNPPHHRPADKRNPASQAGQGYDVFVAATDDLEDREQELSNHLVQAGLRVSPRRFYGQASLGEFEAAVGAEMANCRVFAQLLNTTKGTPPAFESPLRLPALLAKMAKRQTGMRTLQWRDPLIDLNSISDPTHRALLDAATACPIEEFKRSVVAAATQKPDPPPTPRPPNVLVFVDHLPEDSELAEQVRKVLWDESIEDVQLPIDGNAQVVNDNLEDLLNQADGMIEVFGCAEPASLDMRMRHHKRILGGRDRKIAALAILEGPPGDQEKFAQLLHAQKSPSLLIIDSPRGVKREDLADFITRLRNARDLNG